MSADSSATCEIVGGHRPPLQFKLTHYRISTSCVFVPLCGISLHGGSIAHAFRDDTQFKARHYCFASSVECGRSVGTRTINAVDLCGTPPSCQELYGSREGESHARNRGPAQRSFCPARPLEKSAMAESISLLRPRCSNHAARAGRSREVSPLSEARWRCTSNSAG